MPGAAWIFCGARASALPHKVDSVLVGLDRYRLKIFRFEDLPAVQTLYIVDTVPAGDDRRFIMLTGCCHTEYLGLTYPKL